LSSSRDESGVIVNAVVKTAGELRRGREAYANRAWLDAYTALSEADRATPLQAADLELLATSASMVGRMDEYAALLERVHHAHLDAGETLPAARAAFWLGMTLAVRGEMGPAGGWFGRMHDSWSARRRTASNRASC
jgi:hypothetical protein